MLNFFRQLQLVHNPPEVQMSEPEPIPLEETAEFRALARQYVHFCQSRQSVDHPQQTLEDLKILMKLPEITHIAFRDGEQGFELLLGIQHVYITARDTGKTHDIGEFVMLINRKEKRLRFINITGPMQKQVEEGLIDTYHHPHVNEKGEMCISSGRDIINEFLAEGKVSSAVRMLIKALHTVDEVPFFEAKLDNWPQKR